MGSRASPFLLLPLLLLRFLSVMAPKVTLTLTLAWHRHFSIINIDLHSLHLHVPHVMDQAHELKSDVPTLPLFWDENCSDTLFVSPRETVELTPSCLCSLYHLCQLDLLQLPKKKTNN